MPLQGIKEVGHCFTDILPRWGKNDFYQQPDNCLQNQFSRDSQSSRHTNSDKQKTLKGLIAVNTKYHFDQLPRRGKTSI